MISTVRRALVALTLVASSVAACGASPRAPRLTAAQMARARGGSGLPVQQIEQVIGAHGSVSDGVLEIDVARKDIGDVKGPRGVTFTPSFEIHGELFFQPLEGGRALMNGNMALLPNEADAFFAALLKNGLVIQAYHQHMTEMSPQVWFSHFRGVGDPIAIAQAVRSALAVTATPLPQPQPKAPSTSLDPQRLAKVLHGRAHVGEDGVVTVAVERKHGVRLGQAAAQPGTGVATTIELQPLGGGKAAVVPDFGMTASEVDPVMRHMLVDLGWFQGCLYNQETDEHPQLYFDHMLKTGDAYQLAAEIRSGLDLMDTR